MKLIIRLLFVVAILCNCWACSDEEYVYPSVLTDFVCGVTDETGTFYSFTTDKDVTYSITNKENFRVSFADTTYRLICTYQLERAENHNAAYVYSLQSVFSAVAEKIEESGKEMKTDPVTVESIWRGGDYINLAALVKIHSLTHRYSFVEKDIQEEAGKKKLFLEFYHDRLNDIEGYTQRYYFSLPLFPYKDILQEGDLIYFTLNTYNEGTKTYVFCY